MDRNTSSYIGEQKLASLLLNFSCPQNPNVEYFLLHNAIDFTKKDQSVTYLVFSKDNLLVGFFSLALKPIDIRTSNISKTMAKKLARNSIYNAEQQTYTTAAYLIAQLGKNYNLPKEFQIDGSLLLKLALKIIAELNYAIGGVMQFLECENNSFLLQFYEKNQFRLFDQRITTSTQDKSQHTLHQLLKFV